MRGKRHRLTKHDYAAGQAYAQDDMVGEIKRERCFVLDYLTLHGPGCYTTARTPGNTDKLVQLIPVVGYAVCRTENLESQKISKGISYWSI